MQEKRLTKIIDDFIYSGKSDELREDKYDDFCQKEVPEALRNILKRTNIAQSDFEEIKSCIVALAAFLSWYSFSDDALVFTDLAYIFNSEIDFNRTFKDLLNLAAEEFLECQGYYYLVERCCAPKPMVEHFWTLLKLFECLFFFAKQDAMLELCNKVMPFLARWMDEVNVKTLNVKYVHDIIESLFAFGERLAVSQKNGYISLFNFIVKFLKSNNLERTMFGVDILTEWLSTDCIALKELLREQIQNSDLVSFITTHNFHRDVVSRFISFLSRLAKESILTSDHLFLIVSRLSTIHSSEKNALMELVSSSVASLHDDEKSLFIDKLIREAQPTEEMVALIGAVASKLANSNDGKNAILLLDILFKFSKESELQNVVENAITKMATREASAAARVKIITFCKEGKQENELIHNLMIKMIMSSNDFNRELGEDAFEYFINIAKQFPERAAFACKCILKLPTINERKLNTRQVEELSELDHNQFVDIISKLFDEKGYGSFDDRAFEQLGDILDKITVDSDVACELLFNYAMLYNYKKRIIDSNCKMECKTKLPYERIYRKVKDLQRMRLVTKAIMRCSTESLKNYFTILIQIHTDVQFMRISDMTESILNIAKDALDLFTTPEEKTNINKFIKEVVLGYESNFSIEFFGVKRHIETQHDEFYPITIKLPNETKEMTIGPCLTIRSLRYLIAAYERVAQSTPCIRFENRELLELSSSLSERGIFRNALLTVTNNTYSRDTPEDYHKIPTLILDGWNFQQILLNELDECKDESSEEVIWDLLKLLPDDKVTLEIIRSKNRLEAEVRQRKGKKLKYLLQVLHSNIRMFNSKELFHTIVLDPSIPLSEKSWFLQILCDASSMEEDLIPIAFEALKSKKKRLNACASLIIKRNQEAAHNYVKENLDAVSELIKNMSVQTFNFFKTSLTGDMSVFIPIVMNLIDSEKDIPFTYEFFGLVFSQIDDTAIIAETLPKVINKVDLIASQSKADLTLAIARILKKTPEAAPEGLNDEVTSLILRTQDEETIKNLVEISKAIGGEEDLNDVLLMAFLQPINQWSYSARNNNKCADACGLRNMGSTCYMNSVLQQLYATPSFLSLFMKENFESEEMKKLQDVFLRMKFSQRKFVDTKELCSASKGIGGVEFDPRQQEDAGEYFNDLMDRAGKAAEAFKGEITSTISGITKEFVKSNVEEFVSLSLEVQNCSTIQQSFKVFLEEENFIGDNQIDAGDLGKIDAKKNQYVSKLPEVLVLNLKRFNYSVSTGSRYKINTEYEFPDVIDARPITKFDTPQLYSLSGVIMHAGTADGGHYTSIIRSGSKWRMFNDSDVSYCDEREMKRYGGLSPSAYVLFYTKNDSVQEKPDMEITEEIEEDNTTFLQIQASLSNSILDVVTRSNVPYIMLLYFINVFAHSNNSSSASKLASAIKKAIKAEDFDSGEFFTENADQVKLILYECPDKSIINAFTDLFIKEALEHQLFDLVTDIIQNVSEKISWRQTPAIYCVSAAFAKEYPAECNKRNWARILVNSLDQFYRNNNGSFFFSNADFSEIITTLLSLDIGKNEAQIIDRLSNALRQSNSMKSLANKLIDKLHNAKLLDKTQQSFGENESFDILRNSLFEALINNESFARIMSSVDTVRGENVQKAVMTAKEMIPFLENPETKSNAAKYISKVISTIPSRSDIVFNELIKMLDTDKYEVVLETLKATKMNDEMVRKLIRYCKSQKDEIAYTAKYCILFNNPRIGAKVFVEEDAFRIICENPDTLDAVSKPVLVMLKEVYPLILEKVTGIHGPNKKWVKAYKKL